MLKKIIVHGLLAGILAGIASLVYQRIYKTALGEDFGTIITLPKIFMTCIAATLVASLISALLDKWFKGRALFVFNLVFVILSFASIIGPISMKLPLEIEAPELFPGLTIPMHFFPALAWLMLCPLFYRSAAKTLS